MSRDHIPVVIEEFNGFWKRGDSDTVPQDHFVEAINVAYIESGFRTRDGIEPFITVKGPGTENIVRIFPFDIEGANDGFITLDTAFDFYHVIPNISTTLILHVTNAEDFNMVTLNGRAYITPFKDGGLNDFTYVYNGDGTTARKIGGVPPKDADGAFTAATGAAGSVEAGLHIFGVVYETNSGFDTQIGPETLEVYTAPGGFKVDLSAIPISPNAYVDARRIVASKFIDPLLYDGNPEDYQLFFVPDGFINDNVTTVKTVDFFDSELLDDASHLLDLHESVENGQNIGVYHNRLVIYQQFTNNNIILVSYPGEYEAFDQIDGFILAQNDGLGFVAGQEYRDILYAFKINQTLAINDNGDAPTSWPVTIIDNGLGSTNHGICFIDIRSGMNLEFILVANFSGIWIFNGVFQKPEVSYKIKDYWIGLNQILIIRRIQLYNDPIKQLLYISLPDEFTVLIGDYSVGLNAKDIKWGKWTFDVEPTTIALTQKDNKFIIGSDGTLNPASESVP